MDFPPLKGTVETPTLREAKHGYSLLTVPGYDRKSGLFFDPGRAVFPAIPATPTKVDANIALQLFTGERGILKDFLFTDSPSEPKGLSLAVALALLLTSVSRRCCAPRRCLPLMRTKRKAAKHCSAQWPGRWRPGAR